MDRETLLTPGEHELLLNCVHELHSFRDLPTLRSWLLDTALPSLVPSDWLSYNEVDLLNPENTLAIVKPEMDVAMQRLLARFKEVVHQHPLITRQMHSADFPVHKISDFMAQEEFHRLELYQDVYRHMGVEYQIAATLRLESDSIMAFALSRRQSDYTERDRMVLELLRPHLVLAFNNQSLAEERQTVLEDASLALNALAAATISVNPEGRILNHTGPGLQWIGATSPGVLPARIYAWLRQRATRTAQPTLHLTLDTGCLHIRAVPTGDRQRLLLVLTRDDDRFCAAPAPEKFTLSRRQWEVARWICQGKTNAEIATILAISPRTVHKHVEHIFKKLGVESRHALTILLSQN